MNKPNLNPVIVLAVALIISSLILSFSMKELGKDIVAAGVHSRKISISQQNGTGPFRILLDDNSKIEVNMVD